MKLDRSDTLRLLAGVLIVKAVKPPRPVGSKLTTLKGLLVVFGRLMLKCWREERSVEARLMITGVGGSVAVN